MAPLIPFNEILCDLADMFTTAHEAFQTERPGPDRDAAVAELFEFQVADWLEHELFVTPQAQRRHAATGTAAAGSKFGPMVALATLKVATPTPRPVVASLSERLRVARERAAANGQ